MHRGNRGAGPAAFIAGIAILGAAVAAGVLGMRAHEPAAVARTPSTAAGRLIAEIRRYRANASAMTPEVATRLWFELFERAGEFDDGGDPDLDAFDLGTSSMVGQRSMLAALPPPAAWPRFRAELERRTVMDPAPETLALRYLAELLNGDRPAALATLARLESQDSANAVRAARALLARLYGDAAAQVSAFETELEVSAEDHEALEIPDLLALAGPRRAEELLTKAMVSPRSLQVSGSDPMRRLTRSVALANVSGMARAQWGLADSIEAASLYEAMSKRFGPPDDDTTDYMDGWRWRESTNYYLLAMVRSGRQSDAERTLDALQGRNEPIEIPREAVDALQRAQLNEPLYRFLDRLLAQRPDVPAWNVYFEQAAFTGHSRDALARIDGILARKDLAPAVRGDLQSRRFAALLAADQVDQAQALALELLGPAPTASEPGLWLRLDLAKRALQAGRLLGRAELAETSLRLLKAAVRLPPDEDGEDVTNLRETLYSELRRMGRAEEALSLARAELGRKPASFTEAFMRRMGVDDGRGRSAAVEVAGIHLAAGRHEQVVDLMQNSPSWGAADLSEILADKDSQGVPMGVIAARALAATGDQVAALRVAHATANALPGNDAGYELIATLDPGAIDAFDQMFSNDQYEERPLIWKATVQLARGDTHAAEATIRSAIAVDPSDGEEGPGDRMRAYAVLAEILLKHGDSKDAALYARAVEAIRISEHADQLHAAGLYDRAFRTYREALEKFSDAYCIQSRLAVQLNKQGRRKEALEHYRRAYELMPDSFGRVESHCFGCENVFQGEESQSLAERVFTDFIRKSPDKPQAYYLLAYLREQQGRHEQALQPLRSAVSLDARYLNAWKRIDGIAEHTFIEAGERDIARLKLLELDPLQRHAHYDLTEVGDLRALWEGAERAHTLRKTLASPTSGVYLLVSSAALREESQEQTDLVMADWRELMVMDVARTAPSVLLHGHVLVVNTAALMGISSQRYVD